MSPTQPHLNGYQVPFQGQNGRRVMMTTYLHLATRVRLTGVITLLPLCAFMADRTLKFYISFFIKQGAVMVILTYHTRCTV